MKKSLRRTGIFGVGFLSLVLIMLISCNGNHGKKTVQPAQIQVTNQEKVYEGIIVEGPTYLADTLIAVVGVEIDIDGQKIVKPALISNFTYEEMRALKEFKSKVRIKGADIQGQGETFLFVWLVQK